MGKAPPDLRREPLGALRQRDEHNGAGPAARGALALPRLALLGHQPAAALPAAALRLLLVLVGAAGVLRAAGVLVVALHHQQRGLLRGSKMAWVEMDGVNNNQQEARKNVAAPGQDYARENGSRKARLGRVGGGGRAPAPRPLRREAPHAARERAAQGAALRARGALRPRVRGRPCAHRKQRKLGGDDGRAPKLRIKTNQAMSHPVV